MIIRKEVAETDRICKMIRREKEEHDSDSDQYRSADELISEQKRLYPDGDKDEEPDRLFYSHTLDNHHHSYLYHRGRMHPMLERKKR